MHEQQSQEISFFLPKKQIYKLPGQKAIEGWLSQSGTFWACKPEEHDEAAWYILRKHHPELVETIERDQGRAGWNQRTAMDRSGYVQISQSQVMPTSTLSEEQVERLLAAGLKIDLNHKTTIDEKTFPDLTTVIAELNDSELKTNWENFVTNKFYLRLDCLKPSDQQAETQARNFIEFLVNFFHFTMLSKKMTKGWGGPEKNYKEFYQSADGKLVLYFQAYTHAREYGSGPYFSFMIGVANHDELEATTAD